MGEQHITCFWMRFHMHIGGLFWPILTLRIQILDIDPTALSGLLYDKNSAMYSGNNDIVWKEKLKYTCYKIIWIILGSSLY